MGRDVAGPSAEPPPRLIVVIWLPNSPVNTASPRGSPSRPARGPAALLPPHLAQENAVRVEELVAVVSHVAHHRGAVAQHHELPRHVELAGPFARGAEFAQEVAGRVEDEDACAGAQAQHAHPASDGHSPAAVDDVEVPVLVELDVHYGGEHLPVLAVQHADAEDILEVGVQALVASGKVDDFLGREGSGGGEGGGEKGDRGRGEGLDGHPGSLLAGVTSRKHVRHSSSRVSGTPLRRRSNRMASGIWTPDTKDCVAQSSGRSEGREPRGANANTVGRNVRRLVRGLLAHPSQRELYRTSIGQGQGPLDSIRVTFHGVLVHFVPVLEPPLRSPFQHAAAVAPSRHILRLRPAGIVGRAPPPDSPPDLVGGHVDHHELPYPGLHIGLLHTRPDPRQQQGRIGFGPAREDQGQGCAGIGPSSPRRSSASGVGRQLRRAEAGPRMTEPSWRAVLCAMVESGGSATRPW